MFLINPQITPNVLNNDGYNTLLENIDKKIAILAKDQFLADAYAVDVRVEYTLYDRLCEYREIMLDKFMGCNCLDDQYTLKIISKIQKLIK